MNWVLFWLLLHIGAAIIAFGPTFTFPIFGIMVQKEPQHVSFALRLQENIAKGIVVPVGLTMLVSGVGLIFSVGVDLPKTPYLLVAIALYLIAMAIAVFVLVPTGARMVRMLEGRGEARALATAGPGAQAAFPPPEFLRLVSRQRALGMFNTLLLIAIIVLMVIKPGGIVTGSLFG